MISDDPYEVVIRVSAASARLRFHGCEAGYIAKRCHASCCRSSTAPSGIIVSVHPTEHAPTEALRALGGQVRDGLVVPRVGERRCPAQQQDYLCALHAAGLKPFGCVASPFTLNRQGTLIVRNRYRLLACYQEARRAEWGDPGGDAPPLPAYVAFRASLDLIMGAEEAERLCAHLDAGGGDEYVSIPRERAELMWGLDAAKAAR